MTARKPVSALALGLSSAVVFGFGASQASADVNQVVQHRSISLQGDPTPSPVLALSAVLCRSDAATLLRNLDFSSQVRLAQLLRRLPDMSGLERTRLYALARSDQLRAQALIAASLARLPNMSRAQARMSAALLAAVIARSPALAKVNISTLPDLTGLSQARAHAIINAIVAKLAAASSTSSLSSVSRLSREDAARVLLALQRVDLSAVAGLSAGLNLSNLLSVKLGLGLDLATAHSLAAAVVAKSPGLSEASVIRVLTVLGKTGLSKIYAEAGLHVSARAGLSRLSRAQIYAIAAAIAAQEQAQAQAEPQAQAESSSQYAAEEKAEGQASQYAPEEQAEDQTSSQYAAEEQAEGQASSLSEADVAAAQDALTKIDPASLPDLSKVDLSKLGVPPQ
jgi:hypothetical protein